AEELFAAHRRDLRLGWRFPITPAREAARGDEDVIVAAAIGVGHRSEKAAPWLGMLAHHDRAGTVAEEHCGLAMLGRELERVGIARCAVLERGPVPRHEARVRIGADDEDRLRDAGVHER